MEYTSLMYLRLQANKTIISAVSFKLFTNVNSKLYAPLSMVNTVFNLIVRPFKCMHLSNTILYCLSTVKVSSEKGKHS